MSRHKSGSSTQEDQLSTSASSSSFTSGQNSSSVNSGVLQTFRELSIHKGPQNTHSASRQAAIAAKKASTPVKPEATKSGSISKELSVSSSHTDLAGSQETPVVVLRKQPRILKPEELKARQSVSGREEAGSAAPQSNNVSLVQETQEKAEQSPVRQSSKKVSSVARPDNNNISSPITEKGPPLQALSAFTAKTPGKSDKTPSSNGKDSRAEAAIEKVNAAKQKIETLTHMCKTFSRFEPNPET